MTNATFLAKVFTGVCALCLSIGSYAQQQKDDPAPSPLRQPVEQSQPDRIRIMQGVTPGLLIRKVQPKYPKNARKNHVEGTVILQAQISAAGDITDLKVVSGDELLVPSALKAVKQWKYRPYILEGKAVEVETEITVNYRLAQ